MRMAERAMLFAVGGSVLLSLIGASLWLAWMAWPVNTGQVEIQRWMRVELSSQNMLFYVGVICSYVAAQWGLRSWRRQLPRRMDAILYPALGVCAGVTVGWMLIHWSLVTTLG